MLDFFQAFGTFASWKDLLKRLYKGYPIAMDDSLRSLLLTPSGPFALPVSSDLRISNTDLNLNIDDLDQGEGQKD